MSVTISSDDNIVGQFSRLGSSLDQLIAKVCAKLLDAQRPDYELIKLFDFSSDFFLTQCREWAEEQVALKGTSDPRLYDDLSNAALTVSHLEDHLINLLEAITWSQYFAGYLWWIRRRQGELGVSDIIIIPTPGTDFLTDTNGSTASSFEQFADSLSVELDDKLSEFRRIRILTVPRFDGTDARWHPLTLGHELAHLSWDKRRVVDWLAEAQKSDNASYAESEALAVGAQTRVSGANARAPWFLMLVRWLMETACDTFVAAYYGIEGLNALESYVRVKAGLSDSSTHPPIGLRLDVQKQLMLAGSPPDRNSQDYKVCWEAYCALAPRLREATLATLSSAGTGSFSSVSDEVRDLAIRAITKAEPHLVHSPSSQDWPLDLVRSEPSAVESGLVRALWYPREDRDPRSFSAYRETDCQLISRSMESLSFLHEFQTARQRLGSTNTEAIADVLWVSRSGVSTSPNSEGNPSFDIRLGRFFIAFMRNYVPILDSLDAQQRTRQLQREIEIGWGDTFILHPNEMVLGVTFESLIVAEDCTVQVLSRSSLGRLGLLSATAVQVQPGFRGCLTLELVNLSSVPLKLTPGQRVAQLVPYAACGKNMTYKGHYQDADWKPRFSNAGNDWDSAILASIQEDNVN